MCEPTPQLTSRSHSGIQRRLRQGDVLDRRYRIAARLTPRGPTQSYVVQEMSTTNHLVLVLLKNQLEGGMTSARREQISSEACRLLGSKEAGFTIRDVVDVDGECALITNQWVRTSLRHLIAEQGLPSPQRLVAILCEVSRLLAKAHRLGVAHEHFSLESIFIRPGDGHVATGDFGTGPVRGPVEVLSTGSLDSHPPSHVRPSPSPHDSQVDELMAAPRSRRTGNTAFLRDIRRFGASLGHLMQESNDSLHCLAALQNSCIAEAAQERVGSMQDIHLALVHLQRELKVATSPPSSWSARLLQYAYRRSIP